MENDNFYGIGLSVQLVQADLKSASTQLTDLIKKYESQTIDLKVNVTGAGTSTQASTPKASSNNKKVTKDLTEIEKASKKAGDALDKLAVDFEAMADSAGNGMQKVYTFKNSLGHTDKVVTTTQNSVGELTQAVYKYNGALGKAALSNEKTTSDSLKKSAAAKKHIADLIWKIL